MDEENVIEIHRYISYSIVYIYNGILFSHEKEGNHAICDNMDEPGRYYIEKYKSDKERQTLYDVTYMWNLKKLRGIPWWRSS